MGVCMSLRFLSCLLTVLLIYPCVLPNIPFLPVGPQTPSFRRAPVPTKLAYMAAVNRSILHNTFIYSSDDLNVLLGGLWVSEGITNANLYSMIEIFCIFSDIFNLQYHHGPVVERDNSQLQPGDCFVVTNGRSPPSPCIDRYSVGIGSVTVTDEVPLLRTPSQEVTTPVESFLNTIRYRDRHCVLMGWPAQEASYDDWTGFSAAHIFPLEYEGHWNDHDFSKWVTVPPAAKSDRSINSPQNGILLNATAHAFFYSYHVSINPDVQNPRPSSLRS